MGNKNGQFAQHIKSIGLQYSEILLENAAYNSGEQSSTYAYPSDQKISKHKYFTKDYNKDGKTDILSHNIVKPSERDEFFKKSLQLNPDQPTGNYIIVYDIGSFKK